MATPNEMKEKRVRILLVEDNPGDVRLVKEALVNGGNASFDLEAVDCLSAAIKRLGEGGIDVVLTDLGLLDSEGLEAFLRLHSFAPTLPIIVLTGTYRDESLAIKAIRAGAQDYMIKEGFDGKTLARSIRYAIERKKMEEALWDSQALFKSFMDNSPTVAFMKDKEGQYVYVNKPFENFFHVKQKDLLGKKDSDWLPGQTSKHLYESDQSVLSTGKTIEVVGTIPMPGGVNRDWLMFKFLVKSHSEERFVGGVAIDITERKKSEEAIRKAHAQTETVLSSITSILIGVDQNGSITHWNAVAARTFGVPAVAAMNRPFFQCPVQWDSATLLAGIVNCRSKNRAIHLDDIRFLHPNGQEGFLGFTVIPVSQDPEGHIECILFGADITERKRIDELKNEFVSTVSHELRTPLTVIKEGVSQVFEGILGEINDDQKKFLSISLEGIDRLGRIVDDLLDISKIEAGRFVLKREHVDIIGIAKQVCLGFNSRSKEKSIRIETSFSSERIETYIDPDRISQVFTNLIANALKFTEKGQIKISVIDKENEIECSVKDTGQGISPSDFPKVFGKFQQFYRTAGSGEKGTGLGLAICKGIVEAHRGRIWLESQVGKGSTFNFTLPKFTAKELFKEHISQGLKEAIKQEASLSIIVFDIENFDVVKEQMGEEKTSSMVLGLENVIKQSLRRQADVAIKDTRAILVLLPATGKEEALMVAGRIQQSFDDYLSRGKLQSQIKITCQVATFPEDGNTEEELLNKVGGQ